MSTFQVRRATAADLDAVITADGLAFGMDYVEADHEDLRKLLDLDRFHVAEEPDEPGLVGVTGSFAFDVTLPGGAALPVAGVTWVSVSVTHRRRGVLRALLTAQHEQLVADGCPLSALTASEGGIYGRFGFGPTTPRRAVEIDRRRARLRADLPDTGGVRQVDAAAIREHAPPLHRRWAAQTPGGLQRSEVLWDLRLSDRPDRRGGASRQFHLAHPDGYATFRRKHEDDSLRLLELVALTPQAHRELWRTLLATDLVETIHLSSMAPDDPLPLLLTDPRQVRTTSWRDGMWLRVLDVPAALSARRYAVEVDVVLGVHDGFLDRGGRFRLRGGPDGASCEPTSDAAEVRLDATALGPLLLGGRRVGPLTAAQLVSADDPQLLRRLDLALDTGTSPVHGTEF